MYHPPRLISITVPVRLSRSSALIRILAPSCRLGGDSIIIFISVSGTIATGPGWGGLGDESIIIAQESDRLL